MEITIEYKGARKVKAPYIDFDLETDDYGHILELIGETWGQSMSDRDIPWKITKVDGCLEDLEPHSLYVLCEAQRVLKPDTQIYLETDHGR